ncbi:hypothetical protein [Alteribacter aurantiacus]|uniref:hypothetical protein n=1 Tax=Alteribacter aurantiacus TaxID=254410 RepID=UPI0012EBFD63|nr:hypothetical protein [Alteribacter aurantiacus]
MSHETSMYEHYKRLISIRQEHPMLFTGDFETIGTELVLMAIRFNLKERMNSSRSFITKEMKIGL